MIRDLSSDTEVTLEPVSSYCTHHTYTNKEIGLVKDQHCYKFTMFVGVANLVRVVFKCMCTLPGTGIPDFHCFITGPTHTHTHTHTHT